jgi:pimeloyl-ACP methyl ester carboxylesterase
MDAAEANAAAIACAALSSGREQALEALPGVTRVKRVRTNREIAKQRLGDLLGEVLGLALDEVPIARAVVVDCDPGVMAVFKGTASFGDWDPNYDVAYKDLDGFKRVWEARGGWMMNVSLGLAARSKVEFAKYGYEFPGIVHGGFAGLLSMYDWSDLTAAAERAGDRGLILAGHSQGGAVATLAAYRLASQGLPVRAVYSFGSPRAGDEEFKAAYGIPHFRFETVDDAVPLLCPLPIDIRDTMPGWVQRMAFGGEPIPDPVNFRHVGELVFIDDDGDLLADGAWLNGARMVRFVGQLLTAGGRRAIGAAHRPDTYVEQAGLLPALNA